MENFKVENSQVEGMGVLIYVKVRGKKSINWIHDWRLLAPFSLSFKCMRIFCKSPVGWWVHYWDSFLYQKYVCHAPKIWENGATFLAMLFLLNKLHDCIRAKLDIKCRCICSSSGFVFKQTWEDLIESKKGAFNSFSGHFLCWKGSPLP